MVVVVVSAVELHTKVEAFGRWCSWPKCCRDDTGPVWIRAVQLEFNLNVMSHDDAMQRMFQ